MSRIPVYDLPEVPDHTEEQTGALIADAYGQVATVAAALDSAILGSAEFTRQNVRRPQGMLTRQANGAVRRVDTAVRSVADQLDARVANSAAEIAGRLRGIKSIADVVRALSAGQDPYAIPVPAAAGERGQNEARATYQAAEAADAGRVASGMLPQGGTLGGGSQELGGPLLPGYSIGDAGAVPEDYIVPQTETETGAGGALGGTGFRAEPVQGYAFAPPGPADKLPPAALHPELQAEMRPPAQRQRPEQAPCCPPPPVVNVTVQPARVDLSQLAAFLDRLPWRQFQLDAFPQAPPTGGAETPGFDPSQIGDVAEDENGLPFHGEGGALSDPAEQALAAARAIALALSFIR